MKKYQDILRDQTSRNFAAKNVNTSLLLLPLRLETKITKKNVDVTDEPERALDAFVELHSIMQGYYNYIKEKRIDDIHAENALHELKSRIRHGIHEFEKIDLLYAEDKALLQDLANNIYETLDMVELQDTFAPLIETLDDITRLTTYNDKNASNFLHNLEHVTRMLENTATHPLFCGKNRARNPNSYSQTARFRIACKRYKEVNSWFEVESKGQPTKIEYEVNMIQTGLITKSQCDKFERLIERIWRVVEPEQEKNDSTTISTDYKILTNVYPFSSIGEFNDDYYKDIRSIKPASLRNKYYHYKELLEIAQKLFENIKTFHKNILPSVKQKLNRKVSNGKLCPTRYTLLTSRLMNAELAIINACSRSDKYRRYLVKDAYHRLKNINDIIATTYFTYSEQCEFVKKLVNYINTIQKERKAVRSFNISNVSKCKVTNSGNIHKTEKKKCLCLRIYPDVVALTQTARQISRAEYLAGKDFWLKYIYNTDSVFRKSLWLAMCDLYPAYRAAFILKRTFPKANYSIICRKAKDFHDNELALEDFMKEIDDNFVNSFPTTYVDNGEELFSIPVTSLLPDRFVVNASLKTKKNAIRTISQYGHRLPKQLQVGLDLNNLDSATEERKTADNKKQLYLNGGLQWMTDYDEAERMGMAITVPLSSFINGHKGKERQFEFSQIFVYGINDADNDEASKMIEEMFTAHLYSDKAMDIISFDTASNIITSDDAKYAFDSSEDVQRNRFQHQPHNCVTPHKPEKNNDLDLLDKLFCLKDSVLGNIDVPGEAGTAEVELQRTVNKLMIEYMTDDKVIPIVNPLLTAIKNTPSLYDYLCKDVLPRGPFPMMRIGDQPYGILPACDLKHLALGSDHPLNIVKKILLVLTAHWNNILSENIINCYGMDGDGKGKDVTTQDYLSILGNTPQSNSFYNRKTVSGDIIDAAYFRGEVFQHQIEELSAIAKKLKLVNSEDGKEKIKSIIPDYDYVPIISKDSMDSEDLCFTAITEALQLDNIIEFVRSRIENINTANKHGVQLNIDRDAIRLQIIESFDLFNYRLDAWLMGILNNKLRSRMDKGRHRMALGCFGWLFNLRENDDFNIGCTNEYIIAPSVNQAITGAIMRSSYKYSVKNDNAGVEHDYDMGINLSSERVRSAIRIIEGIQNGLSLGAILGADMERLIHEAYKADKEMELDSCIYSLRQRYPLTTSDVESNSVSPANITVLNGASLLDEYSECKSKAVENAKKEADVEAEIIKWLENLGLFEGDSVRNDKIKKLREIIDVIDDEKDALTDVVLTESVYKLTQGNTDASHAIMRALSELRNIPMPEVSEIPIASAQIDGHMLAMLPANAEYSNSSSLLAATEPKMDQWLRQMMISPADICMQVVEQVETIDENNNKVMTYVTSDSLSLGELGISASEMVYLSADKPSFTHFVEVLSWMKTGVFKTHVSDKDLVEYKDGMHAFSECAMAIDDLRKVIVSAHALTNDDLVKQTGMDSQAVYNDMSNEYHHVKGYITRLLCDMQDLINRQLSIQNSEKEDYVTAALPDDMVAEAIRILLDCYRIGNQTALDNVNDGIFIGDRDMMDGIVEWKRIVEAQHSLFQSMQTIFNNMQAKFEEAEKIIADDAEHKHTTYVEAIKKVLVAGYLVVPAFRPDANVPIADLADQANGKRFVNINQMELETIIGEMAQVEEPMMNLHQVRLFQKCNDIDVADISPMQIASVEDNTKVSQWLGTEVASEQDVKDAFIYIVMNPDEMVNAYRMQNPILAGIVIDHWVERIPYSNQTAAVAFGYDQPDAEAPQTLLLAMATKDNKKGWNEKMLVNSLKSAIHMVKCRTVSPDMLCKDAWASGLFPLLEYRDPKYSKKSVKPVV